MEVHFENLDKFKRFIEKNAILNDRDVQYFINHLIINVIGKRDGIYFLSKSDTVSGKEAYIRFNRDVYIDRENDIECIQIQF